MSCAFKRLRIRWSGYFVRVEPAGRLPANPRSGGLLAAAEPDDQLLVPKHLGLMRATSGAALSFVHLYRRTGT